MELFEKAERDIRSRFGDCTIIFSGSRVARLHMPSSDIDAVIIGSEHGTYFTRVDGVFVDAQIYNKETFLDEAPCIALATKLLLYPTIVHGDEEIVAEKQRRIAAGLPKTCERIVEAYRSMRGGYRLRNFARAGMLEERLEYIQDLQSYDAPPQPATHNFNVISAKLKHFFSEIPTNPGRAGAKLIGLAARRAEDLHWHCYTSALDAAYGETAYSRASDVLHWLNRRAFHQAFPKTPFFEETQVLRYSPRELLALGAIKHIT